MVLMVISYDGIEPMTLVNEPWAVGTVMTCGYYDKVDVGASKFDYRVGAPPSGSSL
jgi:hypothetical protein